MKRSARSERRNDLPSSRRILRSGARTRFVPPIILVVDDVEDNRELVALVLGRHGYHVEVAVDGLHAIGRAQSLRPSMILMDLAMPNMDGFEATRSIRQIPELASVHIVALSACTDSRSIERALAAGCNAVLAKPCPPDALVSCVEAALPVSPIGSARHAG